MAAFERFEDIIAWQRGRELCQMVYAATKEPGFIRDRGLCEQMRRAAVSVISNIAEGCESQNNASFVRYLYIARGSCGEVRAQAYVARDQDYVTQTEFEALCDKAIETSRLIAGLIAYLRKHLTTKPNS